ncbi:hypothetical protein IG631_14353 [Alternaria alternata]|nr:hypothetical protein IG631_14353 [Alternaria alternata]
MRAAVVPFTILAIFGQTIFAQSCQPDGGIGFNINVGDLDSVRCCSGCGWNSCRLGDVCCLYSDIPRYKFFSSNIVCCSHREHFIIARRLRAVHAICNLASVDDFQQFRRKRGIEEGGVA